MIAVAIALRKTGIQWFRQLIIFLLGFLIVFTPWLVTGRDANGSPYLWVKILDVIKIRYTPGFPSGELNNSPKTAVLSKVSLISKDSPNNTHAYQDPDQFPYFVINHALHNVVASFLILPDSFSQTDQELNNLLKRPYLDENQRLTWQGEISARQIPFLAINLVLLAFGFGWSWSRWKWSGLLPAWFYTGYIISLGLARNSGSRYIVPIDWILFLYYLIGIFAVLEMFTTVFENSQNGTPFLAIHETNKNIFPVFAIVAVFSLSVLVPIAQIPIVTQSIPSCENQIINPAYQNINLLEGKVFYPYFASNKYSFLFLTCNQFTEFTLNGFDIPLESGQKLIIEFSKKEPNQPEKIFFEENSEFLQVWTR